MSGPFDLADNASYQRWREKKLDSAPRRIEDIVVALDDPRALSEAERNALLQRCAIANMVIYASKTVGDADKEIPRGLGRQLGREAVGRWHGEDALLEVGDGCPAAQQPRCPA